MKSVRHLVRVLMVGLAFGVGAAAAAVFVSQTAWFKDRLRDYVERRANQFLNGTVSIGRLRGNLWHGLGVERLTISMDGAPVAEVEDVALDYTVFELVTRGLTVDHVRVTKPTLYLRQAENGWSITRLVKSQPSEAERGTRASAPREGGSVRSVSFKDIAVSDGTILIERTAIAPEPTVVLPARVDHLDAAVAVKYAPDDYAVDVSRLSFRLLTERPDPPDRPDRPDPPDGVLTVSVNGGVSIKDDTVRVNKLALQTAESSLAIDGTVKGYAAGDSSGTSQPLALNLRINSPRFSLPELSPFVPSLAGVRLRPAFEFDVDGPLDRLGVNVNVRDSAGQVAGRVVTGLSGGTDGKPPQSLSGELSVRGLDLAPLLRDARWRSDIAANARFDMVDVASPRGTISLTSSGVAVGGYTASAIDLTARLMGRHVDVTAKAAAYGANVATEGKVMLPDLKRSTRGEGDSTAFDLRGQARGLNLQELPRTLRVPPVAADINADYHIVGTLPASGERGAVRRGPAAPGVTVTAQFLPSLVAGAAIAGGSTAGISLTGGDVDYRADLTLTGLDVRSVSAALDLPALKPDRYATSINGHIVAEGRGTALRPQAESGGSSGLVLTTRGTLNDSRIGGGRLPGLSFSGAVADDRAHVEVDGAFEQLDPAILSDKRALKGALAGHLSGEATIRDLSEGVNADSVQAAARITIDPSMVGGFDIARAALEGDYAASTLHVRTFEMAGHDLSVTARGTLAINEVEVETEAGDVQPEEDAQSDNGQSNLKVHAESSNLETIGQLFGHPLSGSAQLDATVTGNRREYRVSGNAKGDVLKFDQNGAASATTDFRASLKALDLATAALSGTTRATGVTIGGQTLDEVTARTEYANRELGFDIGARQPERSLAGAGALSIHPENVDVRVTNLAVQSRGTKWQTAAGTQPVILINKDDLSVTDLDLVSGPQHVSANGSFGGKEDALHVALTDVDVATIDQLLVRQPQFSGRLNASATVTGTRAAPLMTGDFAVEQGGFRQFTYNSLRGTVRYEASSVDLDVRLQQNPATWIAIKGYAPLAPGAPRGDYDLHIDSSPIELGLVQPLATPVDNLTGTMQAKVDITGPLGDPRPQGVVTIANGAFKLLPTGVAYSKLEGRIDLLPEKVHIDELGLADNRGKRLTVTGDLAVREREVAGVAIEVNSTDFKILDNKMGNMRVDSRLRIAGELGAPRIDGDIRIAAGQINLDPIVAAMDQQAYATEETQIATAPSAGAAAASSTQLVASGGANREGASGLANQGGAAPGGGDRRAGAPGGGDRGAGAPGERLAPLQMWVHVTAPNAILVKADDLKAPGAPIGLGALNLTLGSDLQISKSPWDQLRLFGAVNTVRGFYDFQGRRFTILRDGRIRFEGLDDLDAVLDIRAERVIQSVTAKVNIGGRLKRPQLALSSTPPLEEADILSLIVFNQPINQLGEGQQASLASRAQAMALSAATGPLSQSIGNALGLNQFEVNVAPEGGGAPEVTLGQQLGQSLYFKVQQGIGDQAQTNLVLEYELTKWLRFRTNMLQGSAAPTQLFQRAQGSGVDLLFFFSY